MTDYKSIEADNSGVPKNFMIACHFCRWSRRSSGIKTDLVDLHEVNNNCSDCGKFRRFKCPKCGHHATMKRIDRR